MLRKGFTLIETLIVIGIIIVIAGFSLAAHRNFDETRKLEEVAKQVVGALELTKKDAITGNYRQALNATCTSRIAEFSWGYVTTASGTRYYYIVGTKCYNIATGNPLFTEQFVYLPSRFIWNGSTGGSVQFKSFSRGITMVGSLGIKNLFNNKSKSISIDSNGNISIL